MGGAATRHDSGARRLIRTVRRRVRLRSRLRPLAERWRRWYPRRLPAWQGSAPGGTARATIARRVDRIEVTAESVSALRIRLSGEDAAVRVRALDVVVTDWERPQPTWSGRLGPLPGLVCHEARYPQGRRGPATVRVELAEPAPLRQLLAALLPALEPGRPLPAATSPEVATGDGAPHWLRPEPANAQPPRADSTGGVTRPYDIRIGEASPGGDALALPVSPHTVTAGGAQTVVVDASTANPRGRERFGPELPVGSLCVTGAGDGVWWEISRGPDDPTVVVAGRVGDPLDDRQRNALRQLRAVVAGETAADVPPAAEAAAIAQLAMTGVVLHLPVLAEAVAALLAAELVTCLREPLPDADPIQWEIRSVVQRRAALRRHAAAFAFPRAVSAAYPALARPPAVSALLVTRRPRKVPDAVAALAAQTYPELEIIVGLHGCDLDVEQLACDRPVQVVPIPAELNLGEALGEATRCARGSLVTKVDDDDRYGPEHIWDLVLARHYSGATVVGKGAEFVHVQSRNVTVRRWMGSELFTDVVAGGTILISRGDLEAVGGWRPMARSVDRGLLDRVLDAGGLVYRTHPFGFVYTRHDDGHTWDPGVDYFLANPRQKWRGLPPYAEFGAT